MSNDTDEVFIWRAHPARERPMALLAATAIIAAAAAATWISFGVFWAIAAGIVLVLALNRFFFPSRFHVDREGISAAYLLRSQRMRWNDVRRFVCDARGGFLSTRSRASRFDAFSGTHILFGSQRDAVIEHVRRCRDIAGSSSAIDVRGDSAWAG